MKVLKYFGRILIINLIFYVFGFLIGNVFNSPAITLIFMIVGICVASHIGLKYLEENDKK